MLEGGFCHTYSMFRSVVFYVERMLDLALVLVKGSVYTKRISVVHSMGAFCGGWVSRFWDRRLPVVSRAWMRMYSKMQVPCLVDKRIRYQGRKPRGTAVNVVARERYIYK